MHTKIIKCVAAAALATIQITANATLIEPLEYESGGLIWLQLSETAGLSLNDFATGAGGWNTKYRFALDGEIDSLLGSFGLRLGDTGYQQDGFGAGEFVFSIGGSTDGAAGTYFSDGNQGALGRGLGRYVFAELTNGDNNVPLGPNCDAYFSCSRFQAWTDPQPLDARGSAIGLFLVRQEFVDVPSVPVSEPSALGLLGVGAILLYRRRVMNK